MRSDPVTWNKGGVWRTKKANAEEWLANGEHKKRFLERATRGNRYIGWVNKIRNNESQKTEVSEAQGLCRKITLLQEEPLQNCTASVSTNSCSLNGDVMTGSLYNTSTWHVPRGTLSSQHPSAAAQHIQAWHRWKRKEQSHWGLQLFGS